MKPARLLIVALFPFMSLVAHAQENVIVQKRSTVIEENSSEHNRMGKKWVLELQGLGIGPAYGTATGLIGGMHLDRNTVIQIEALSGDRTVDSFEKARIATNSVGVHAKKFLANSFYVVGGIDYTNVDFKNNYLFFSNETAYSFKGNLTSATILIGNQWQWDTFTLGCDWIGLSLPIAHNVTSEYADDSDLARKYLKEDKQALFENGTAQLLRFYVGATF